MDRFLEFAGVITRWFMAALACWWLFWFITLIAAPSDNAQYLAGTALMKAIICGGAAAIWFYRARTAKTANSLRKYPLRSQPPVSTALPRVIPAPETHQDTQPVAVVSAPERASEPQGTAKMICGACGKESAGDFTFCPYCGKALVAGPPAIESAGPPQEVKPVTAVATEEPAPRTGDARDRSNKIGTYVFGAFSVIALLVSLIKGIVPIYLVEAAVWAGAAWYWHRKKTHSELAKAVVIVLAVLIAIGEVIQIARQFGSDSKQTLASAPNPFDNAFTSQPPSTYQSPAPASAGESSSSGAAENEQQAVALYKQKRYSDSRLLFYLACYGGEMKGCNYLGYLYAKGLGGPQDTKKARDVYQKACDEGTLSSCASLGSLYQDAGNNDEARKYFQKACNGGVTEACDLLRSAQ